MRVLIVARPFTFHGGVETATSGLLGALVAHGHEVHRAGPGRQAPLPGVTDHPLRVPPLPSPLRALALVAATARIARDGRWDVVQSHERTLTQDVYRAGEGCHRGYLAAMEVVPSRPVHHRVVLALERRVFRRTPEIVAISRAGAEEIGRLYGVPSLRLSVVYNGVDLERFHPRVQTEHRAAARAEIGVAAQAWLLLFAGSGFERKGLEVAIRALAALDDRRSRLLVVGRGDVPRHRAVADAAGVADRIVWLGVRPDIERWYAAADVLVLPTRYEPFGNVHLEALATGLPVVTSRAAGGAEALTPACGAAVDPRAPGAFATAIAELRARPSAQVRAAARAAAEPFTFARQVADLTRIYKRVAGRNR
jgi:UDP-glucose:(heptosyl)LPS alpha-1,3-glucosyltransferase